MTARHAPIRLGSKRYVLPYDGGIPQSDGGRIQWWPTTVVMPEVRIALGLLDDDSVTVPVAYWASLG